MLPLLFSVCLILFCWLIFACECFLRSKPFRKKKQKKKHRLEIVLITSLYYTTSSSLRCANGNASVLWCNIAREISHFGVDGFHHRSSHLHMFFKIEVLKNFAIFTGRQVWCSLFFDKVVGLGVLWWILWNFLKTTFL